MTVSAVLAAAFYGFLAGAAAVFVTAAALSAVGVPNGFAWVVGVFVAGGVFAFALTAAAGGDDIQDREGW